MAYYAINTSDSSAKRASELYSIVSQAQTLRAAARKVQEAMTAIGSDPDWTAIEAKFGLTAGDGETVYNILTGVAALCDGTATAGQYTAINQLCELLGL